MSRPDTAQGNNFLSLRDQPSRGHGTTVIEPGLAEEPPSLTQGCLGQTLKSWLRAHPNTEVPHVGCPVILGSYLTSL